MFIEYCFPCITKYLKENYISCDMPIWCIYTAYKTSKQECAFPENEPVLYLVKLKIVALDILENAIN